MLPPGALPPGAGAPQGRPMPLAPSDSASKKTSEAWSPWGSLGAGLLLAGGVTWLVTSRRRQQLQGLESDGAARERQRDDQRPGG